MGRRGGGRRLCHRADRVGQGNRPPVPNERAHLTRQPVVRVHQIEPAVLVPCLGTQQLASEGTQLTGELALVQTLERSGLHMMHAYARGGLDTRCQL